MDKSPDAFRTISEVADVLETPAHVLRFWESRFVQIKPVKRAGGRRYYRPTDVALLAGIKRLLHDEGLTIRGVQKILRDQGTRHVAGLSDDSVGLGDLVTQGIDLDEASLMAALDADGGGDPIEVEDVSLAAAAPVLSEAAIDAREFGDNPAAFADLVAALGPVDQIPDLPLFAAAAAVPAAVPAPAPARPTLRDDASFSSLIRALPTESLFVAAPKIAPLARRLAALRAQMAARADGGLI
ncbi:HTH_MlrA-like_sg2 domain containing protein [Paracoccaceae bacterium]|jgi:DNA-binding transcriptional MerR regulator